MSRKRIAVHVDFAIRTPNFISAYTLFKKSLFGTNTDEFSTETQQDIDPQEDTMGLNTERFYWKAELSNPECEEFYIKSHIKDDLDNYDIRDWDKYFFKPEHKKKFEEEYSFNLYADAEECCKRDIHFLNTAQSELFDVFIIDDYIIPRKKLNTMYFLSKVRVMPQAVVFLGPGQNIDPSTYFGVWNPLKNTDQINKEGEGDFEMWLKELEAQNRLGVK